MSDEQKIKLLEDRTLRLEKRLNDIHRSRLGLSILGVRNILGQDTEVLGDLYVRGDITSEAGSTVGGVDIGAHVLDINAHHSKMSVVDSGTIDFTLVDQQLTGIVIQSALDHGSIGGLSDDDHPQYTLKTRQIISGNGLSGGGDLSADRTLAVGAGTGISVGSDSVGIDLAANLTWSGNHVFQGGLSTRHLLPELTDTYDLGSSTLLWRKGWLSELDSILFAQNTITLLGGWFVVGKGEGSLPADVGSADSNIDFGKSMTTGQFVVLRSSLQVEYVQVGSLVSGTTYNVTRNLDGSGANNWAAGTVFLVLGVSGDGRIELNAYDTPRMSILEQGATYNAQTERIRIGDLAAWQGAGLTGYGMAMGDYAGDEYLAYSPGGGLVVRGTIRADDGFLGTLDISGKLSISGTDGKIAIGNPPPTSSTAGTGIWLDRTGLYSLDSGSYQTQINATDGKFYAGGGVVVLDEGGISISSFYGTTYNSENALKWITSTKTVASIIGTHFLLSERLSIEVGSDSTYNRVLSLSVGEDAASDNYAEINMSAPSWSGTPLSSIVVQAKKVIITGGTSSYSHITADEGEASITVQNTTQFNVVSNQVLIVDGIASKPGLGFIDDTDTGIYRPGSDQIGVATGGIERARIAKGLYVGRGADAGAGNIAYTGALKSYKNSTEYTGYIFVPLTTPLTSTAWDGDARSAAGKTLIDLSAVFGVPAGVKAVNIKVSMRDSGSAAGSGGIVLGPNATAWEGKGAQVSGIRNDAIMDFDLVVPCNANGDIYYQTYTSGAGTLDVWLQIWGYWI